MILMLYMLIQYRDLQIINKCTSKKKDIVLKTVVSYRGPINIFTEKCQETIMLGELR